MKKTKAYSKSFKKLGCLLIILLVFFTVFLPVFSRQEPVSAAWWNSDWDYFKVCNVADPNNNYQMMLIVNKTSSGGDHANCSGHCQDDFGDIRFLDIDNSTSLDYWLENYTSGVQATFWINTSSDVVTDQKILMYYGTSGASSTTSNGDNTFQFFSDFEGTTKPAEWTEVNGVDVNWSTDGEVELYNDGWISTSGTYGDDIRVRSRSKSGASYEDIMFFIIETSGDSDNFIRYTKNDQYPIGGNHTRLFGWCKETTTDYNQFIGSDVRNWHTYMIAWDSGDVLWYQDDSHLDTTFDDNDIINSARKLGLRVWDSSGEGTLHCDWIWVGEWINGTNPTWSSFGSEQTESAGWTNTAPTITASSENPPNTQTGVQKLLVNYFNHFNITVADVDNTNQSINVTWRTNESGSWQDMGYNESTQCNSTFYCTNVSWVDSYSTKYYWSVNVSDNHTTKGWVNATYNFTTEVASFNKANWSYYKTCTITNPLDDYQTKIIIGNSSGGDVDCEGHIEQSDFKDIRFLRTDNTTEIYHWMRNVSSDNQATFWINNSYNDSMIILWYGNSTCTNSTYKDGDGTFTFFDNFAGSLDTNKWNNVSGVISTSNGVLEVLGTLGTRGLIEGANISQGSELRVMAKWSAAGDHGFHYGLRKVSDWNYRTAFQSSGDFGNNLVDLITEDNDVQTKSDDVDSGVTTTDYNIWSIGWTINNATYRTNDNVVNVSHTTNVPSCDLKPVFYESDRDGENLFVDWLFIRNYTVGTEPSVSFGNERQDEHIYYCIGTSITCGHNGTGDYGHDPYHSTYTHDEYWHQYPAWTDYYMNADYSITTNLSGNCTNISWDRYNLGWGSGNMPIDDMIGVLNKTDATYMSTREGWRVPDNPEDIGIIIVEGGHHDINVQGNDADTLNSDIYELYNFTHDNGIKMVILTMTPDYRSAMHSITNVTNSWRKNFSMTHWDVWCADVFSSMVTWSGGDWSPDGSLFSEAANYVHPNDAGYTIMGELVADQLYFAINNQTIPFLSGEYPINGSTGVVTTPSLHVVCNDNSSDIMTATWRSNSSGSWATFATNSSINSGTNITQTNSNFSVCSTTYYWSVNLTDGDEWYNKTYHFTTDIFIWIDITNATWDLGNVVMSSSTWTNETGITFIADMDNCTVATDLKLQITNDGADWTATTTGNAPAADTYRLNASINTWVAEFQIITASSTTISSNIVANQNETFDLRFDAPTSTSVSSQQSITVTATLVQH